MKGISLHSIIPVRAEAREGAEQNTQILFGETFEIINHNSEIINDRWRFVRLDSDGQEGWIDAKMCTPMTDKEYSDYRKVYDMAAMVAFPMTYAVSENNGQTIPLTAGTRLTNYQLQITNGASNARFEVLGVGFRIDPNMVIASPLTLDEPHLQQAVRFFLNTPYLWGGKNALGMDCSGFTQVIFSLFGVSLPRNASQQVNEGQTVKDLSEAQAGDLVFFDHQDGKISHVGIILAELKIQNSKLKIEPSTINCTVVHCSGRVKVEKLDETGIYNTEQDGYSHHLVCIKRVK